ncbi:hypothetical protein S7711_08732 [Stachybotrys chartarum IBT 7711]|uniref:Uncharacterized protein n=1 Tax=Stachybotrys chartarum (strain CBS 109288 / IBT 7711) TaxID=1280523 RepID=A0A084AK30_STACB|nr:hypothetical protein S7711_08732 [Stachybotrys chartarum IBT 7711]
MAESSVAAGAAAAPVQVRPHPQKGRALHATRPFQPGQVLLALTPLLLLPSLSHAASVCTYCFRPGDPRACLRCHAAFYCGAACQAAHWAAVHGRECKPLRRAGRQLPTPVRALVQVLLDRDLEARVAALEGHVARRRGAAGWEDVQMMAMGASAYAGQGTSEDQLVRAVELLCKIQTNAFHRYDVDLGQVGIFLEPTLAMANHSCIPNAFVQFIGRKAILRAETPIEAGQEIEISYTGKLHLPTLQEEKGPRSVCAESPSLNLNQISVVPNLSQVKKHAAVTKPTTRSSAKTLGEALADMIDSTSTTGSLSERHSALKLQLRRCQPLMTEDLWAVSPLPQLLTEVSIYFAEKGAFASALVVACFVATSCDPYRHPAPHHPVRVKGLFMIAKLLANTAAETAALAISLKSTTPAMSLGQDAQETLQDIDQVSLCQMLLIMVLGAAPAAYMKEWDLSVMAREMLADIEQLPGREKETSLIDAWKANPRTEQSQSFFEYAVVQQVKALAGLAAAILKAEFA